jgi:phage/plasmid-associated DNA primase
MNFRGLYKGDTTLYPTINNICATNVVMKYNGGDKAVMDRLIQVPFNNKFEIDDSFQDKVLSKRDYFFSYIMNKGTIKDKFNFSEEMKLSKQETMDDNIDTLKEYIDTNLISCKNDKKNKPIKIDLFRQQYSKWLKENGHPADIRHKSTFTKAIRTYGIETKESNSIRRLINVRFRYDEEEDDDDENEEENQTSTTEN